MAVINLKVTVDGSAVDAEIKKINQSFNQGIKGTAVDNLQKKYANLISTVQNYEKSFPKDTFSKQADAIRINIEQLKKLSSGYEQNGKLTAEGMKQYRNLSKEYVRISKEIATLRAETEKLEKSNKQSIPSVDNLRKKYANLLNTIQGSEKNYKKGTFSKIAEEAKANLDILKNLDPASDDYAKTVNHLDEELNRLSADFSEARMNAGNFHGSIKDIISGFAKFTLAATLVMKPIQMLRSAWNSLNEVLTVTESRAVAIARVLKEDISADEITSDLYHLAQEYGQTFENVQELATNFARSGLDWAKTTKAVEAALLALNVAELDATQASEGLLAIMTQFGYEAEDLLLIVDKLNITADNANVTTEKLLTALQRTGSSAKNAKMDLEETVGVITALSEATNRSGENLGTAINSLIQFSTKSSSLETFSKLGGDVAKSVENYQVGAGSVLDIWKALSGVIQNNTSNSEGILSGLFSDDDWRTLNEELQTELGENFATVTEIYDTASTFRKNYFIALLNNMDQVESTLKDMEGANGYSQKENLEYLNTYEGKLNSLTAQWQELTNEEQGFLEFKKDLLDLASVLLTVSKYTGGLRTVVILLATGLTMVLVPAIKLAKIKFTELGVAVNASLGWIGLAITAISAIVGLVEQIKADNIEEETEAINKAKEGLSELQTELDEINQSYEKTIKEIQKYRAVLDDSSSLESEKEKAQLSLIEIQNSLTKSNEAYANSLNLVNGKLEDQIGLTKELQVKQIVDAVKDFQQENAYGISLAKARTSTRVDKVAFGDTYGPFDFDVLTKNNTGLYNLLYDEKGTARYGLYFTSGNAYGHEDLWDYLTNPMMEWFDSQNYLSFGENVSKEEARKRLQALLNDLSEGKGEGILETDRNEYMSYISKALESLENSDAENLINGNKNSTNWIERLSNDQRMAIASGNLSTKEIEDILISVGALQKEITKDSEEWRNSLDQIGTGTLDTLVEKLKEARDATKDAYDYENKKKAVLEAEKALLDAQNNRTVRVYNRQTGTWEFASSAKEVQEAQENLDKARLEIEQAAYENIIKLLKDGDATNEALLKVMAHWAAAYGSGDFSGIEQKIFSLVESVTGVDLNSPSNISNATNATNNTTTSANTVLPNPSYSDMAGTKMPTPYDSLPQSVLNKLSPKPAYDNGGVLNGLGGIKATTEDEVVLSPEITKRLLSPVPNAQFDTFVKDLGILFGASESATRNGVVLSNRGGNTDSHDTSYTVNGVPISPQVAETKTVKELFELMPLIT